MSENKSGLEKARGEGIRSIVAAVVMAEATTRKMMDSVSTERVMLKRQLYIRSL